ncbi:hypothetical protein [Pedobacter metabolipauper]|uniref:Uncharacterized protein n=1 Tax=Pedobacter metabolipauper TaxID=425513 RepID=A0A4R6SUC0_9SPHI|nr:hypothetical protein [Pedobacter metabolipauper]TDQ08370.1 hypothetical protein ATK78_2882 [Pedobacter metabolipauper]
MKNILNLSLIAICIFGLSSCSKYYINTVSGVNIPKDEKTGKFILENDTVQITYNFFGENAPVQITVQNKLTVPIYVDWSKSSLIFENNTYSYVPEKVAFTGDLSATSWNGRELSFSDGTVNGKIDAKKEISFIPPQSKIETTTLFVESPFSKNLPDSMLNDVESLNNTYTSREIVAKAGNFTPDNSPVKFRSYLTLFSKTDNIEKPFSYDKQFYISKSVKTTVRPGYLSAYKDKSPNVFYTRTQTGYGKAMTGIAVVGIVAGTVTATNALENNSKK